MNDHPASSEPQKLAELKEEFASVPQHSSWCHAPCPTCSTPLSERDRVGGGVSSFDVTTLYYCDHCGYFKIGATYWTSDY